MWPAQGMSSSSLDAWWKEKGKANLSPGSGKVRGAPTDSSERASDTRGTRQCLGHTAALQTAKNNAIAAAQRQVQATLWPSLYDFRDITTAEKIRDEGFPCRGRRAERGRRRKGRAPASARYC